MYSQKHTPKSSRLYGLVTHYKLWYGTYLHKCECFFSNFLKRKSVTASKPLQNNKRITSSNLNNHKITKSTSSTERHCVSRMKLLTSCDIKLNPDPEQNLNSQTILSVGFTMLLNLRLRQLGLRPVDVGGEGDCFFLAVSHQLPYLPLYYAHLFSPKWIWDAYYTRNPLLRPMQH